MPTGNPLFPLVAAATIAIHWPAGSARAAGQELVPGEYITAGGWGTLTLSQERDGGMAFVIETVGANAHTCDLEGAVRDHVAVLDVGDAGRSCTVRFARTAGGIAVAALDADACRYFCGVRAVFEGEYLIPNPGCTHSERRATREGFKALYARKSYEKALQALAPLLGHCAGSLDWIESGWIRNDVAITQYRLGRLADCRRTLQPLAERAAGFDGERVDAPLLPADHDSFLPIAQATRHNLKLCGQGAR